VNGESGNATPNDPCQATRQRNRRVQTWLEQLVAGETRACAGGGRINIPDCPVVGDPRDIAIESTQI
jgi:hypothetical protein